MNKMLNGVASFFSFKEHSATFKKEIIGGISTFLAMAYILAVNPSIMSGANGAKDYAGVFFLGTAISSMVATLAMGLYTKVPVALAPGMGVNAFFAYTVASSVLGMQVEEALVATFVSGLLYVVIALSPLRTLIAKMLPKNVKLAMGAMIGLFLAYIGLADSGIIVSGATSFGPQQGMAGVATATKMGNLSDPFVIIAIITLVLVFALHILKIRGAAIIAMIAAVVMMAIAYGCHVGDADKAFQLKQYSDFGKFGDLSSKMWHSFGGAFGNGKFYIAVFVFLYNDFFDTTGTLFGIGEKTGWNNGPDQGEKWMKKANVVDAGGTIFGSLMLTSTVTTYGESTVGISQGAKTGFASVITATIFGLAIAIWPIMTPLLPVEHVQHGLYAQSGTVMPVTGPILVLVGALMLSQLKYFEWAQLIDIPVLFVTLTFGMLSYSISTGLAAGMVVYYALNAIALGAQTFNKKRGKTFEVNDEEIGVEAMNVEQVKTKNPDFKARVLNPVAIVVVILAITYFATMPLYDYA